MKREVITTYGKGKTTSELTLSGKERESKINAVMIRNSRAKNHWGVKPRTRQPPQQSRKKENEKNYTAWHRNHNI